jgi:hypothetical protein
MRVSNDDVFKRYRESQVKRPAEKLNSAGFTAIIDKINALTADDDILNVMTDLKACVADLQAFREDLKAFVKKWGRILDL